MTEIRVASEITLRSPGLQEAALLFELIDSNREHLGRWLPALVSVESIEQERAWLQGRIDDPGVEHARWRTIDVLGGRLSVCRLHGATAQKPRGAGTPLAASNLSARQA